MSKQMVPGFKDETYISDQKGWYEDAQNKHNAILTGIKKDLVDNRFEILYKYTMGLGNTGIERVAYYLGWITVGKALEDGDTFIDLMTLQEDEVKEFIIKYTDELVI